ncbi:hypothetical protein ACFPAF_17005 [Hymenobacter endophyticus]|uniref:Uncharacterized protein n=1 Tax=Hymenobacter endophyticus TaxID=3076335 RepID=A0ABU3TL45_9BACT|nr:hypothetical protein [Hymenobacter endophyticus]MDU0372104.1 hypothetical protein [Hymenobacter endophyticus]
MAVTIPANDRKAAILYLLSVVVAFLSFFLYRKPLHPTPYLSQNIFDFSVIGSFLLMAGLSWPVRAGRRWAKIVLLLLCVPSHLFYLIRLPSVVAPWPQTALNLLSGALQLSSIFIITRDLLRRPMAGEAGVAVGGRTLLD